MPFLDSSIIRPLYDVRDGGPPVGFVCCFTPPKRKRYKKVWTPEVCKVTRTLAGMRTHQRIVHGIRQQQEFQFESVNPTLNV
jgi:hypothetical protein